MSQKLLNKFIARMDITRLCNLEGMDGYDPGSVSWLSRICLCFAGCHDDHTVAANLMEVFSENEFKSALRGESGADRENAIRCIAQRGFDEFWRRLECQFYEPIVPVKFDSMPDVLQHLKEVTQQPLFHGAEWPMSEEAEKKFCQATGIGEFLLWEGTDEPGTVTWLSNYCLSFAGIDDGTSSARHLSELFLKNEFDAALTIVDETERHAAIRNAAKQCFEQFWRQVEGTAIQSNLNFN
jgi:hypothetical protein